MSHERQRERARGSRTAVAVVITILGLAGLHLVMLSPLPAGALEDPGGASSRVDVLAPQVSVGAASRDGSDAAVTTADTRCGCEARNELRSVLASIRGESSVERARELAIGPTALASRALSWATRLSPVESQDLERASERLERYRRRVAAARNGDEVAAEFESMFVTPRASMRATGTHADIDVDVESDGCDYSGGEIIATVLGFVLGILPGIILLILLC